MAQVTAPKVETAATKAQQEYDRLIEQGSSFSRDTLEGIDKHIDLYQQALVIARSISPETIADTQNLLSIYFSLKTQAANREKQFPIAQKSVEQALSMANEQLAIARQLSNSQMEMRAFETITLAYSVSAETANATTSPTEIVNQQYQQLFSASQQALNIAQKLGDRPSALRILERQTVYYISQGQMLSGRTNYSAALDAYEKSIQLTPSILALVRELKDATAEQRWTQRAINAYIGRGFALGFQQKYLESALALGRALDFWRQQRDRLPPDKFLAQELNILTLMGTAYRDAAAYEKAQQTYQAALEVAQKTNNVNKQIDLLTSMAWVAATMGKNQTASEFAQQSLELARKSFPGQEQELTATIAVAKSSSRLGRYAEAEQYYQEALKVSKSLGLIRMEQQVLINLSSLYTVQGEYLKALVPLQQVNGKTQIALRSIRQNDIPTIVQWCGQTFTQQQQDHDLCLSIVENVLADNLNSTALVYDRLGRYTDALTAYQEALAIASKTKDQDGQIIYLNNIGRLYGLIGNYPQALEVSTRSLEMSRAYKFKGGEADALSLIGNIYMYQDNVAQGAEYYQQAFAIAKVINEPQQLSSALNNLGFAASKQNNYVKAREYYQQTIATKRQYGLNTDDTIQNLISLDLVQDRVAEAVAQIEITLKEIRRRGDRPSEINMLRSLGIVYANQSNFAKAQALYQEAQSVAKSMNSRANELENLQLQGRFSLEIGQYPQALTQLNQALQLSRELGQRNHEALALANIAGVHRRQGNYAEAIDLYQQSLTILRSTGNISQEMSVTSRLGQTLILQNDPAKAVAVLQPSLVAQQRLGVRSSQAVTLNFLGLAYLKQGQFPQAQKAFQESLVILNVINDPTTKAEVLGNLATLSIQQSQPELAIVFYKQSVALYEEIRKGLKKLDQAQQQAYTETVAKTYRDLASLLLQKDRILEAQQILDLLKVQEINTYVRTARSSGANIYELPPETEILKKYGELQTSAIALGNNLAKLRETSESARTPAQLKEIARLVNLQEELNQQFNQFTDRPDIKQLLTALSPKNLRATVDPAQLDALRDDLQKLNAVLIYPLILDDRLELIITTPNSPPLRRTVKVSRTELNSAIQEFRTALQSTTTDAKPIAQKLYNWLIQPLESDLKTTNPQTLIYAPDAQLRYIPLAALYDGQQWLTERYAINHITAQSLTDLTINPSKAPKILAGAIGQQTSAIALGQDTFNFSALPYTTREIQSIKALQPTTTTLEGNDFSLTQVKPKLGDYNILHLATHATLVPKKPENSFILFGSQTYATLRDIENWSLKNFDLVVLSACETGLGGNFGTGGEEILGLGYQFQTRGAKATIASLWQVDDGGTQALMTAFYSALKQGHSKTQALKRAQMALISSNFETVGLSRASIQIASIRTSQTIPTSRLSHPAYWAPFILIGNGL